MPDSIQATFGLNVSPFTQSLARAEAAASASATKITSTLNKVSMKPSAGGAVPINWQNVQAFNQRTLDFAQRRPYRTAQDFLPAPPGKYPAPEEEEGGGRGGRKLFHFFRSVALTTVAGEAINLITQSIVKAEEFRLKIQEITKLTGPGAFRGFSEIQGDVERANTALQELFEKTSKERGVGGNVLTHLFTKGRSIFTGESPEEDAAQRNRLQATARAGLNDLKSKQNELNQSERISLGVSEEKAQLLKNEISHRERLGEIARRASAAGLSGAEEKAINDAENTRAKLADQRTRREFDIRRQRTQIEHQELLDRRPGSGLTETAQQGFSLAARLQELRRQIRISPREKAGELGNEALGVQNQIDTAILGEFRKNPSDRLREQIQATRDKSDVDNIRRMGGLFGAHRDMGGNIIGGVNPLTGEQVSIRGKSDLDKLNLPGAGKMPGKGEYAEVVTAVKSLQTSFEKTWGGN